MKQILLSVFVVAVLAVRVNASSCTGYKITNECVPAENILDGTLGASVSGSGCGATNLGQGVSITYDIRAASAAFGAAPNQSTFTAAGVLQLSSPLTAIYGGSAADLHTCAVGAVPYFTSTGIEACLSAGTQNYVLMANGAGAPSFTNAPTVLGTNVTAIPGANLTSSSLDTTKFLPDSIVGASILNGSVDSRKILAGSINAANLGAAIVDTSKINTAVADSSKLMVSCGGVALWRTGGTCP